MTEHLGRRRLTIALAGLLLLAPAGAALADYVVQVGAFTSADNAARVVKRLRGLGLAEIRQVTLPGMEPRLHAVLVGPVEELDLARRLQNRLANAGWPGFVRDYPLPGLPPAATTPSRNPPPAAASRPTPPAPSPPPQRGTTVSEWSGHVALEARLFPHDALAPRQHDGLNLSVALEPEYYREWDHGRQSFTFVPFLRLDNQDPERSHADIRELTWLKAADDWELRVGIRKLFWGVTESVHLVDIINQVDLVENIDTEDRLGQPMVNLALIRDWGTLDLFLLPGFRERTFAGREGRLRTIPYVDTSRTEYESAAGRRHVDAAIRWSHSLGDWDIGLAHFYGTSREPTLRLDSSASSPVLTPYYPIINQTSLDLQATLGNWLWKLEGYSRSGQGDRYTAAAGGFEYTFVGIFDTVLDLGVIGEYLFDDRNNDAPTLFEDDLMLGMRLALNDVQSSELLFGVVVDRDDRRQRFYNLEASRRLGDRWKLSLEARVFTGLKAGDLFGGLRNDDYLQAEMAYFF
ncbi:SPOR domain-containing protein [Thiohalobacter sp. IOR34]|uniref:SPOR domain-containing protein n=1 Tax=Thiohalobacter sp. IOR34 TaxID=3057176 RepID=UPI0025B18B74|nr:SPOR domain-containing protein [Thiohalobacter sp. IOR34]WJW75116.1 SPOR domain-containing protein [Thiohalobacter sp. IOR34]